jgi:NitT/TauT family transport system substrate-binding protein
MAGKTPIFAFAFLVLALAPLLGRADEPVRVAIGGRSLITYLPFTLADQLGYFKAEGVAIRISDFKGGSQAVEALVGGSADIAIGAHEHTLVIQAKGIELRDVALLNLSYGAVIALKPALAKQYKTPADLKGMKFGVTAPGSASALALELLLAKDKVPVTAISIIGIGAAAGAVATAKSGELDGVAQFDPIVTQLIHDGDMVPIVDTRTAEGMKYLYGGNIAGSAVLTTPKFIAEHRASVQGFVTAIMHALKWLHTASADDVAKTVPASYYGPDLELYKQSVDRNRAAFDTDGSIPLDAVKNIYRVLAEYGPLKGAPDVDIDKSYDNSFTAKH